ELGLLRLPTCMHCVKDQQMGAVGTAVEDRIRGYASGADRYLFKPITPAELDEAADEKLNNWRLQELLAIEPDERGKAVLEVRISRLKRKLHDVGVPKPTIRAVWKKGYQLCVPVAIQT
ncbi:MAG: hypothetical protein K9K38_22825, partial [Rhodoferax sp.]|nr:hypothetical protein [Rhodoferax sp.]